MLQARHYRKAAAEIKSLSSQRERKKSAAEFMRTKVYHSASKNPAFNPYRFAIASGAVQPSDSKLKHSEAFHTKHFRGGRTGRKVSKRVLGIGDTGR